MILAFPQQAFIFSKQQEAVYFVIVFFFFIVGFEKVIIFKVCLELKQI